MPVWQSSIPGPRGAASPVAYGEIEAFGHGAIGPSEIFVAARSPAVAVSLRSHPRRHSMARHDVVRWLLVVLVLTPPGVAGADIAAVARCQKRFAREGARFAQRVIKAELDCSLAGSECQVECEEGVFGPPCSSNPPPCCDPDDTGSNAEFASCMTDAAAECDQQ